MYNQCCLNHIAEIYNWDIEFTKSFLKNIADILEWDSETTYDIEQQINVFYQGNIVDWESISKRPDLSYSILDMFYDELNWENVCMYHDLSIEFFVKFPDVLYDYTYALSDNKSLTENIIDEYSYIWDDSMWEEIFSKYDNLSEWFIRKYQNKLSWWHLTLYCTTPGTLSIDLIKEFRDKVDWSILSEFIPLDSDKNFFIEFKDKLDWVSVCICVTDIVIDGGCKNIINCSEPFRNKGSRRTLTLIELIDCKESISNSIKNYAESRCKYPFDLFNEHKGKRVPKKYHRKIEKMALTLDNLEKATNIIIRQWRKSISNPSYKLCRNVLLRDFDNLNVELMSRL
jgi:hypothetical protein